MQNQILSETWILNIFLIKKFNKIEPRAGKNILGESPGREVCEPGDPPEGGAVAQVEVGDGIERPLAAFLQVKILSA